VHLPSAQFRSSFSARNILLALLMAAV